MTALTPIGEPPEGPLQLALTHDGFEARARLTLSSASDLGVIVAVVVLGAATVWTFWGLFRMLLMGTAATRGFWCLIVAPGLVYWVAQTHGQRLMRDLLGARRVRCTADHLEIVAPRKVTHVPLRSVFDCVGGDGTLELETASGPRTVRLPASTEAQTAWVAAAIRLAAHQARQVPLPPEPPDALSRLRRP